MLIVRRYKLTEQKYNELQEVITESPHWLSAPNKDENDIVVSVCWQDFVSEDWQEFEIKY
jgi:hypothetical protein